MSEKLNLLSKTKTKRKTKKVRSETSKKKQSWNQKISDFSKYQFSKKKEILTLVALFTLFSVSIIFSSMLLDLALDFSGVNPQVNSADLVIGDTKLHLFFRTNVSNEEFYLMNLSSDQNIQKDIKFSGNLGANKISKTIPFYKVNPDQNFQIGPFPAQLDVGTNELNLTACINTQCDSITSNVKVISIESINYRNNLWFALLFVFSASLIFWGHKNLKKIKKTYRMSVIFIFYIISIILSAILMFLNFPAISLFFLIVFGYFVILALIFALLEATAFNFIIVGILSTFVLSPYYPSPILFYFFISLTFVIASFLTPIKPEEKIKVTALLITVVGIFISSLFLPIVQPTVSVIDEKEVYELNFGYPTISHNTTKLKLVAPLIRFPPFGTDEIKFPKGEVIWLKLENPEKCAELKDGPKNFYKIKIKSESFVECYFTK